MIDHDVKITKQPLALMPGSFQLGHVNPLGMYASDYHSKGVDNYNSPSSGEKLAAAEEADGDAPVFRPYDSASCEICWRLDTCDALTEMSPFELKRHIRR